MRKVLSLTALFVLTIMVAVQFRNRLEVDHETTEDFLEQGEAVEFRKHEEGGPGEFLKFHQGIRTRSDEEKPGYSPNYQWTELQNAQRFSAKKFNKSTHTLNAGNGVISYTERGPGNVPGRTRGLIVDPDDATHKTWFAGSASGGIWKTADAGSNWQWLTPSIANLATTTLAMAESNHNTIYAGTGEGFGNVDGITGNGIFYLLPE